MESKIKKKPAVVKHTAKKSDGPTVPETAQTQAPAAKPAAAKKPAVKTPATPSKAVKKPAVKKPTAKPAVKPVQKPSKQHKQPAPALTAATVQQIISDALAIERAANRQQMMMLINTIAPQLAKIDALAPAIEQLAPAIDSAQSLTAAIVDAADRVDALDSMTAQLDTIREQLADAGQMGTGQIKEQVATVVQELRSAETRAKERIQGLHEVLQYGQTAIETTISNSVGPLLGSMSAHAKSQSAELAKFVEPLVAIQADLMTIASCADKMDLSAKALRASAAASEQTANNQIKIQTITATMLTEMRETLGGIRDMMRIVSAAVDGGIDHE